MSVNYVQLSKDRSPNLSYVDGDKIYNKIFVAHTSQDFEVDGISQFSN